MHGQRRIPDRDIEAGDGFAGTVPSPSCAGDNYWDVDESGGGGGEGGGWDDDFDRPFLSVSQVS